jgi:DNA-binding NarL/FixJ family response regulator
LIYSGFDDGNLVYKAYKIGADGYVYKHSDYDEMCKALITITENEKYFNVDLLQQQEQYEQQRLLEKKNTLTPREIQVAVLCKEGLSNKEIAAVLKVQKKTIDNYMENIRNKFGVNSKSMIIIKLLEKGIVDLSATNSMAILNNLKMNFEKN